MERQTNFEGYDLIGDIHGCSDTLEKLLQKLDYKEDNGVYSHPKRQAVFVGDIVDRGPHIRQALHLIKNMTDSGAAQCIMGNHEYNILGYTTLIKGSDSEYVWKHNYRHGRLVGETLAQFAPYPEDWRMFLDWFQALPVFLEMPGFRVVHACWDDALIQEFKRNHSGNSVDRAFIEASADRRSFPGRFMDRLTRGTDMKLPEGRTIKGRDGSERRIFRTKFWAQEPQIYQDVVFQPDPLPEDLGVLRLSDEEKSALIYYDESAPPVFIGHYWLQGKPRPLRPNIACLDYSAVKYGRLVAYRFDGEAVLDESKFEWVYVDMEITQE